MVYQPNTIYHIFNQGNNQQSIFPKEKNYLFFLQKMRKHILPYADFLCYCLMPNHFHWLIYTNQLACQQLQNNNMKALNKPQNLINAIRILLSSYTRAINNQEKTTGSLFRQNTKVKDGMIDGFITANDAAFFNHPQHYAIQCFHYMHNNPVKANLVGKPEDWVYSSAKDYAKIRNGTLCNQQLAKELLSL